MAELDDGISRILGGVTSKTILQDAAEGDFAHVMKLKNYFLKPSLEIDNLLTTKCVVAKRNLIHWLAHHKNLEILEWICGKDPCSMSSSSSNQGRHWPTIALERKVSLKYFNVNAQDVYGFTALHLATWGGHEEIVKALLAYDTWVDVDIVAENTEDLDGNELNLQNGQTALHIAVAYGKFSIVKMLLDCLKDRMQDRVIEGRAEFREALSIKSTSGKTALHYAAEHGKWEVVKCLMEAMKLCGGVDIVNNCDIFRQTPLYLAVSQQNAEVVEILLREGEGLKVNIVTWEGITPLDKAKKNEADRQKKKTSPKYFAKKTEAYWQRLDELKKEEKTNQRIVDMLESYDVNWLHAERAKYANAANCLLVGAALIASITYAGWLQPPLGITQYYEFAISNAAAPPQSFESYVGVEQHPGIQLFWVFNSLSFFCSIATFIIGADAGIPRRCASLREEVVQLRQSTVRASFILSFAIIGVMGAFSVAGILVLPPIERQRAPTYVTVAFGVIFCLILLMQFMKKLWIWFRSPSLQFKLEKDHTIEELSPDVVVPKKRTPNDGPPKEVTPNDGPLMQGSTNFGSPKSESADFGPPEVGSTDFGPPKPESVDFGPPKSGSADLESPKLGSTNLGLPKSGRIDMGSLKQGSLDLEPPKSGSTDLDPPKPRGVDLGPSESGSIDLELFKPKSTDSRPSKLRNADFGPPKSGSPDFEPPKSGSLDFGPSMLRNTNFGPLAQGIVDFRPFTPRSLDFGPSMSGSVDFSPFLSRNLDFGPPISKSADCGSSTSRSADFGSPTPGNADYGPFMLGSVHSLPSMPQSADSEPLTLRSVYSEPPTQSHPNNRPLKRGRANILEASNPNALGKRKYDNICRPFEEQHRRRSFRRYASKT